MAPTIRVTRVGTRLALATAATLLSLSVLASDRPVANGQSHPLLVQALPMQAPPAEQTAPIPGSVALAPGGAVTFAGPVPPLPPPVPPFREPFMVQVRSRSEQPATVRFDGITLTLTVPSGIALAATPTVPERARCASVAGQPQTSVCTRLGNEPFRVTFTTVAASRAVLDTPAALLLEGGGTVTFRSEPAAAPAVPGMPAPVPEPTYLFVSSAAPRPAAVAYDGAVLTIAVAAGWLVQLKGCTPDGPSATVVRCAVQGTFPGGPSVRFTTVAAGAERQA